MVSVQKASSACGTFESRLTLSGTHIEEGGGGVVEGGVIVPVMCDCHLTALRVISVTRQVAGDRGVSNVLLPREWKGALGLCRHGELVVCVCVCVCARAHASACVLDLPRTVQLSLAATTEVFLIWYSAYNNESMITSEMFWLMKYTYRIVTVI